VEVRFVGTKSSLQNTNFHNLSRKPGGTETSRVRDFQLAFAISSIRETGTNICFGQIGKFTQNLSVGHSAGQTFEHVIHSDAQARTQSLPPLLPGSMVMIPAYVIISLYLKPRAIGIVGDRNPIATCWPCVGSLRYHRTGSPLCHIACRCLNSQTAFRSVHEPRLDAGLSMAVRNELSGESRSDPEVPVTVMV
jgi:hypothetical protein